MAARSHVKSESLGTTGIPAFEMTVESRSSSPYESGWINIRATEGKLFIKWDGESEWKPVEWHDIAHIAEAKSNRLQSELDWIFDQQSQAGYKDGVEHGREAAKRETEIVNIAAAGERLKMAFSHKFRTQQAPIQSPQDHPPAA